MNDETIKLTENIQKEFERLSKKDKELQTLLKATLENSKSYTDALNLADRLGANLSEAVKKNIIEGILPDDILSKEIADDIVNSVYGNAFDIAEQAAQNVQKRINESAGLGLNTVSPQTKQERLASLSNTVADKNINEAGKTLTKAARELPQGAVSDTLKANADFQGKSGINARIIRRAESKCCKWCDSLAGSYKYPDVPRDVYRRHANCRCTVEYYPGKGKEKQNVWSKEWKTQEEKNAVEKRKNLVNNLDSKNVALEYLKTAQPGVGNIEYEKDYNKLRHAQEIKMAQWLHDNFGGDIVLLNESNMAEVKTADYLWRGKLWDLKTITSEKAANSALRHGIKQIEENPGGIIFDFSAESLNQEKLWDVVGKRMGWYNTQGKYDVMVVFKDALKGVRRY